MYILASHRIMMDLLSNILSATSELYADSIPESKLHLEEQLVSLERCDEFSDFSLAIHRMDFHTHLCDFASGYGVGGFALNWCWENLRLQDCGIKCEKKWVL